MKTIKQKDKEYPKKLLQIQDPPETLYVEGNSELLNSDSIAIVGTRKYTEYGEKYTKLFANELSKKGICIVSGLASGIDTIAHINSMEENGKTIAVLGSGFDNIYPKENKRLYEKILENGGCVISEYPPEIEKAKENFPKRNSIISGLAMGVLVIEARYRSGASITAKDAIKQHKEVFCLPHSLDEATGYTPNMLIQKGAQLVMTPQDILDYYYNDENIEEEITQNEAIPEEYLEVFELIGGLPISANEIAKSLKKNISEVTEKLCMLELNGYISNLPGNLYVRK